jgi:hypothetical protein
MKYIIKLGGRGADVWVHDINDEQKKLFVQGNVELNDMQYEDIAKILGKDEIDISDDSYTGVYTQSDDIVIEVTDENGNLVFDNTTEEDWYFDDEITDEYYDYESVHDGDNKFFVESYCKGVFLIFEVECEEFDPNKLSPQFIEIGERIELITGLYYDGVKLEGEFDDYWGKGYFFHLSGE